MEPNVVFQSCIPSMIGRAKDLYTMSLFERESLDFKSGLRSYNREFTALRLSFKCGLQVSHLPKRSPRYLISFDVGMI